MERTVRPDADLTLVIVETVAEVTGRPLEELQPLADSIDTDAVASLFARSIGDGVERLEVTYEGCHVTVSPETVTVEPTTTDSPPAGVSEEGKPAHVGME